MCRLDSKPKELTPPSRPLPNTIHSFIWGRKFFESRAWSSLSIFSTLGESFHQYDMPYVRFSFCGWWNMGGGGGSKIVRFGFKNFKLFSYEKQLCQLRWGSGQTVQVISASHTKHCQQHNLVPASERLDDSRARIYGSTLALIGWVS